MTTATYEPALGDVVGVVDDGGIEREGRIIAYSFDDPDPWCWLVGFPTDADWPDQHTRAWFPADALRLVSRLDLDEWIGSP